MQDPRLRHRRRALGWTLLALSLLPLTSLFLVVPFLRLDHQFTAQIITQSWAALTGLAVIALALIASGAYLLRTEGRR